MWSIVYVKFGIEDDSNILVIYQGSIYTLQKYDITKNLCRSLYPCEFTSENYEVGTIIITKSNGRIIRQPHHEIGKLILIFNTTRHIYCHARGCIMKGCMI